MLRTERLHFVYELSPRVHNQTTAILLMLIHGPVMLSQAQFSCCHIFELFAVFFVFCVVYNAFMVMTKLVDNRLLIFIDGYQLDIRLDELKQLLLAHSIGDAACRSNELHIFRGRGKGGGAPPPSPISLSPTLPLHHPPLFAFFDDDFVMTIG